MREHLLIMQIILHVITITRVNDSKTRSIERNAKFCIEISGYVYIAVVGGTLHFGT